MNSRPSPTVVLTVLAFFTGAVDALQGGTTRPTPIEVPGIVQLPAGASEAVVQLSTAIGFLCVRTEVAGKDAGWFFIDTGATTTLIDKHVAEKLQLHAVWRNNVEAASGATAPVECVEYDQIKVGQVVLRNGIAATVDLDTLSSMMGFKVAGMIGDEALREYPFTLDFREHTLTFYRRESFKPPQGITPEKATLRSHYFPCVSGRIEGKPGWFAIDACQSEELSLSSDFVSQHWTDLRGRHASLALDVGLDGISSPPVAGFGPVEILGRTLPTVRAQSERMSSEIAGRIGARFLSNCRITFDFAGGLVWMQRYPDETLAEFLQRYPDSNAADVGGTTPLMRAADLGREDIVAALLRRGAAVNARDGQGGSALFYAAISGKPKVLAALVKAGADVNIHTAGFDESALTVAARHGDLAMVKALIAAGAKLDDQDPRGRTALSEAAFAAYVDVAEALLTAGADPRLEMFDGTTALGCAARADSPELIGLLIKHGAKVDSPRAPPLVAAAGNGNMAALQALIDAGADVNAMDGNGRTPLMWAAVGSSEEAARFLLASGANPNTRSTEGKLAADYTTNVFVYRLLTEASRRSANR